MCRSWKKKFDGRQQLGITMRGGRQQVCHRWRWHIYWRRPSFDYITASSTNRHWFSWQGSCQRIIRIFERVNVVLPSFFVVHCERTKISTRETLDLWICEEGYGITTYLSQSFFSSFFSFFLLIFFLRTFQNVWNKPLSASYILSGGNWQLPHSKSIVKVMTV